MSELLTRAADLLAARWPAHVVEFNWWSEGEDISYVARLEWTLRMEGPRIVVLDGRSGYFVCQSLEGKLCKIDPAVWAIDVPDDEIARYAWREARKRERGAGR